MTAPSASPDVHISTVCLAGTLEDKLHAAAEAGFAGVELLEYDLLLSSWSPERVRSEAERLGLTIEVYQPFHVETLPPDGFDRMLRRADRKLALLHQLGARVLVCCSTRTSAGIDDDDAAVRQLRILADRAWSRGIRLAFEGVPWGRVRSHREAWRIVERVDHPALGLCLDSFHVLASEDSAEAIAGIDPAKIFHVQLADAARTDIDSREWSLHHRLFPGQGVLDVAGFLARVQHDGYDGSMAVEVFNDVYQQEDPRHAATDAMRAVRILREGLPGAAAVPSAPALDGYAFVEFAVDDVSGPLVARSLRALGFAQTGRHRSKPVQLWEQGAARILLNLAPERSVTPATAVISAFGVESADPAGSLRRAESLLATRLARPRGSDEADIASVATPGGAALFFCDSRVRPVWLADFESTGERASASRLLGGIDHVAMTEAVEDFEQSALFLRTVLGLDQGATYEVTAPFGLLRGWSGRDRDDRVRILLSTAPMRRGDWAPAVSSPQYVAFSTDDALACAQQLRDAGASILQIPDNYYDDLDARYDLPPEFVAALRANSVLYHRDDAGAFLHFFTEMVGSRVFFEVAQRVDGYVGFGDARSVPLRMAAHRRQRMRTLGSAPSVGVDADRHDYSLAHLTALSLTPPELVDAAASAGYRYVGLRMTKVTTQEPHHPLATDPRLMRATKTHLAATGVEVLDIELARMTSGDRPRDFVRFLEAGAELGARHVIAQLPDADVARKTDRYAELCALAAPFGLTVDLEFPSWTETPDLTAAVRVLRAAAQPNMGLLVDVLHFARSGSSIDDLRELPREWFHYAHVCDAPAEIPAETGDLIHTARFERLFPGEGGIDVHAILGALPDDIPYALEIPRAMLVAQVGPTEHARLAIDAARRHLDVARVRATSR